MKKYSLNICDKIIITLVFIFITYILTIIFHQFFLQTSHWQLNQITSISVLAIILTSFWIYLFITIIKIYQNKYKAITINYESKQIILFDSNNNINIIPFAIIDHIDIEKGGVVRGIKLCQVRILTKNRLFIVNVSQADEIYCNLLNELSINIQEKMFFIARTNQ